MRTDTLAVMGENKRKGFHVTVSPLPSLFLVAFLLVVSVVLKCLTLTERSTTERCLTNFSQQPKQRVLEE